MARDLFGNRKITKEDRYTKSRITFTRTDEILEYLKMVGIVLLGLAYGYFIILGGELW